MSKKLQIILYSIIAVIIIGCLITAMYLCGYNPITWLVKFWPWVIIILAISLLCIVMYIMNKLRK